MTNLSFADPQEELLTMNTTPQPNRQGTLFIITAPSGAGKTSLVKTLAQVMPDVQISVSYTTRPQRPGEENGIHYWFVDVKEFENMIEQHAFLEHAKVFNNYYGTSRQQVERYLKAGKDVFLTIDWQGAKQIKDLFLGAISIYILPPSADLLRQRLNQRRQDNAAVIEQRMAAVGVEVSYFRDFDYMVINDSFDIAIADLQAIVRANRLRQAQQAIKYKSLLAELLKRM